MNARVLLYLYGRRLRVYPIQELLAGLGIAIGVALAFAVMVATGSVVASARDIVHGVTGAADVQLAARDARGFDERLLTRVRRVPGVDSAAPVLDQRAVLIGPDGREVAVTLVSIAPELAELSGALTRSFAPGGFQFERGMVLPMATAEALGLPPPGLDGAVGPLPQVSAHVRGRAVDMTVAAMLGRDTIGSLTEARLAVVPLEHLQEVAGMGGRVTRILVDAEPGWEGAVRRELREIAAGRLTVTDADADTRLLEQATGPTSQVTFFFAAISALLGFLLAFNAMLLTAPERRRLVSALRMQGYRPRQIVQMLLFQATALGLVASVVGVLAGGLLARGLFSESPEYLAPGFTLGTQTVIGDLPLMLSLAGGVLASCLAAMPPLLDLRRGRAVDAVFNEQGSPGNAVCPSVRRNMLVGAAGALVAASAMLLWAPSLALLASVLLAVATLLALPATFGLVLRLVEAVVDRVPRMSTLTVALLAMKATTLRSLALAATGAVAVFGSIAIGGARDDLLRGIGDYTDDYVGTADLWVANPGDNQATNDFEPGGLRQRIAAVPGVVAVRRYQGGFLDIDGRRAWVIARPSSDPAMLPTSQVVAGDSDRATARLRRGGWVAVSARLADDRGVGVGDAMRLPTPTGTATYRVAAITTNLGWAPGALIVRRRDYARDWGSATPTALEVDVSGDTSAIHAKAAVERVLGADSGLRVQTATERAEAIDASARQGLKRLGEISHLLLAAAVLAMAAAMGAAIWQRRAALASLRLQSFHPGQLWLLLLLEAAAVLGAGGLTGAVTGVYGQFGADRYLEAVTGFPVSPVPAGWQTLETIALVVPTALAIVALPGWFAARVPPRLGLGSE